MIKSMTGFGKGEFTDGKRNVIAEIRTVNHRYSDITVKMPRRYTFAEEKIKNLVKETVKRGKVDVSIVIEGITEEDITIKLNTLVAEQYIRNLRTLKEEFGLEGPISLEMVANMPDVMKNVPDVEDEEEVLSAIEEALGTAVHNLDQMRITEGRKLAEDLTMRGELVRGYVKQIQERSPEVVEEYKDKLYERISELVEGTIDVPEDRILLEAAVFADKTSITEELVRLDSHINQLHPIGSKANDNDITRLVLEVKSEVEKIREQVQNIE